MVAASSSGLAAGGAGFRNNFGMPWEHKSIDIPDPGSNQFIYTIPAGSYLELISLIFTFTASGVAGNRFPCMIVDDGAGNNLMFVATNGFVAAAGSGIWTYLSGYGAATSASGGGIARVTTSFPQKLLLEPGWRILTSLFSLDAGDRFTGIHALFREYSLIDRVSIP